MTDGYICDNKLQDNISAIEGAMLLGRPLVLLFFLTTDYATAGILSWHQMHLYHMVVISHILDCDVKI